MTLYKIESENEKLRGVVNEMTAERDVLYEQIEVLNERLADCEETANKLRLKDSKDEAVAAINELTAVIESISFVSPELDRLRPKSLRLLRTILKAL